MVRARTEVLNSPALSSLPRRLGFRFYKGQGTDGDRGELHGVGLAMCLHHWTIYRCPE